MPEAEEVEIELEDKDIRGYLPVSGAGQRMLIRQHLPYV